ncbi:MAG TPA: hypothetical protein VFV43_13395 [Limnobacter sp.]|nr:hypothetical protein [Limnobacter sp.]
MNNSNQSLKAAAQAAAFFIGVAGLNIALADPPSHKYHIEFGGQTFQANNAVSIDQFDDRFVGYQPSQGQLYGLGENAAYIQATRNGYTLQAYKRQEIFINAGRETGQLYTDINARVPPTVNRLYAVDFDGYGIEHTGLGFGKTFELGQFRVAPVARVYNIDRYREIQASGAAAARADGSYDINVTTVERDTEADFQFPVGPGPSGLGYALDLALQWQATPSTALFAQLSNVFNQNTIKNAPTTVQTINSNVNQFDADGFLNYNPAIQGQNSRPNHTFSLPTKTNLGLTHNLKNLSVDTVGLNIVHINGLVMPRLSAAWDAPWPWLERFAVGYETHFESFDFAALFKHGGVKVGFDTLNDESRRVEYLQVFWGMNL